MKSLELCCGTKSFSKVFNNSITIDIEERFNPDICINILEWDYKIYPEGYFYFIWASPPCISFSNMAGGKHRDKLTLEPKTQIGKDGDNILNKVIEIINYFKPKYFCIENPRGYMRRMPILQEINRTTINYCKYGGKFFKPTDLWNNFNFIGKTCKYEKKGKIVDCDHARVSGNHKTRQRGGIQRVSREEAYSIPEGLFIEIQNHISQATA